MVSELLLKEEVFAVVGAAMEVHRELGNGYLEAVYQEAMEVELVERGVPYVPAAQLVIIYKADPCASDMSRTLCAMDKSSWS